MIRALLTVFVLVVIAFFLTACGGAPVPPSKLVKPSASLMIAPEMLPRISEGDDIVQHTATVRKMYSKETGKLRRLQRWVRTVQK